MYKYLISLAETQRPPGKPPADRQLRRGLPPMLSQCRPGHASSSDVINVSCLLPHGQEHFVLVGDDVPSWTDQDRVAIIQFRMNKCCGYCGCNFQIKIRPYYHKICRSAIVF